MHSHSPFFAAPVSVSTTIDRHANLALYASQFQQKRTEPCVWQSCATIYFFTLPLVMIFNAFFRTRWQILCHQAFWSVIPIQTLFSCMRKINMQLTSQITLHADTGATSRGFFSSSLLWHRWWGERKRIPVIECHLNFGALLVKQGALVNRK